MRPSAASSRNINRRTFMGGAAAIGIGALAGCASINDSAGKSNQSPDAKAVPPTKSSRGTIRVMVWSGLVEPIVREVVLPAFAEKFPNAHVELEVGTNSDLYPKLLASRENPQYTGCMVNGLYAARGRLDGLWSDVDAELIPNASKVPESALTRGELGVPFMLTGAGINFNPTKVASAPSSWTDLFDDEYRNRVVMSDGIFEAYQMASVAAGGDVEDVERGIDEWAPHKENIGAWANASGQKSSMLDAGDVWLSAEYGAWSGQQQLQGLDVRFAVPEEGLTQWMGTVKTVSGVDAKLAGLTAAFFDEFYTPDFQRALMTKGFFIPVRPEVEVPDKRMSPALMTLDEATRTLVQYDFMSVAKRQRDYTREIHLGLK